MCSVWFHLRVQVGVSLVVLLSGDLGVDHERLIWWLFDPRCDLSSVIGKIEYCGTVSLGVFL